MFVAVVYHYCLDMFSPPLKIWSRTRTKQQTYTNTQHRTQTKTQTHESYKQHKTRNTHTKHYSSVRNNRSGTPSAIADIAEASKVQWNTLGTSLRGRIGLPGAHATVLLRGSIGLPGTMGATAEASQAFQAACQRCRTASQEQWNEN